MRLIIDEGYVVLPGADSLQLSPAVLRSLYEVCSTLKYEVIVVCGDSGNQYLQAVQALCDSEGIQGVSFVEEIPSAEEGDIFLTETLPGPHARRLELDGEATWEAIVDALRLPARVVQVQRKTNETDISIELNLDGSGKTEIATGIGFFDHMLEQVGKHSGCDMRITCNGDLHIDEHHSIEDTGLALGEAFAEALGDKRGVERYAFLLPMDDASAQVALDFSGRSWLVWNAEFTREKVGELPTEMVSHFFKSFCDTARCNLQVDVRGDNDHHKIEAIFKGVGRCVGQAIRRNPERMEIPSTKGSL